jgi:hypothetical protein
MEIGYFRRVRINQTEARDAPRACDRERGGNSEPAYPDDQYVFVVTHSLADLDESDDEEKTKPSVLR